MHVFTTRCAVAWAELVASAAALGGIVAPNTITADKAFDISFEHANDDQYRVYLAAALAGVNGPTCYLINSTSLQSPLSNLSIPASVGPSADYYSIAISDLTTGQGATYSNRFQLDNTTGTYTEYENKLQGSPFWSADALPCTAYSCARECAMASYPDDLIEPGAYETMKVCILDCEGVTAAPNQTAPALASNTGPSSATDRAAASSTSESAANCKVVYAGVAAAAAAGCCVLAFLL